MSGDRPNADSRFGGSIHEEPLHEEPLFDRLVRAERPVSWSQITRLAARRRELGIVLNAAFAAFVIFFLSWIAALSSTTFAPGAMPIVAGAAIVVLAPLSVFVLVGSPIATYRLARALDYGEPLAIIVAVVSMATFWGIGFAVMVTLNYRVDQQLREAGFQIGWNGPSRRQISDYAPRDP